ncbi:NAA40 [Symbiodinium microadriaticum]|nr:NAA40 [Symbiodinium microadriaticum]
MKFDRNDLNLTISFTTKLSRADLEWTFNLTKTHMESVYDASGYGWDDDDKKKELSEQGARFLIVRERAEEGCPPGPGEVMDTMAGDPCLYVWDVQLEEGVQRKGLGKHLMMILELIARREKMEQLCVPVQLNDDNSTAWIEGIRGFGPDTSLRDLVGFDAEMSAAAESPQNERDALATPHQKPTEELTGKTVEAPVATVSPEDCEGAAQGEEEEGLELDQEEIVAGLQTMFREKHGREATDEEVALWMEAVSSLSSKLDGVSVDNIDAEVVAEESVANVVQGGGSDHSN